MWPFRKRPLHRFVVSGVVWGKWVSMTLEAHSFDDAARQFDDGYPLRWPGAFTVRML